MCLCISIYIHIFPIEPLGSWRLDIGFLSLAMGYWLLDFGLPQIQAGEFLKALCYGMPDNSAMGKQAHASLPGGII